MSSAPYRLAAALTVAAFVSAAGTGAAAADGPLPVSAQLPGLPVAGGLLPSGDPAGLLPRGATGGTNGFLTGQHVTLPHAAPMDGCAAVSPALHTVAQQSNQSSCPVGL